MASGGALLNDVARVLVRPQAHEAGVTKMVGVGPVRERDLRHQLRLQPATFPHHLRRQRPAATRTLRLWKVRKRTGVGLEARELTKDLGLRLRHEAVAHL